MGYIRHNAIVVTSWNDALINAAACRALNIGLTVLGPSEQATNGFRTMLVCPDGSKEGWEESDHGDRMRAAFRAWMNKQRYGDGSTSLHWVEIAYGSDDAEATVEAVRREAAGKALGVDRHEDALLHLRDLGVGGRGLAGEHRVSYEALGELEVSWVRLARRQAPQVRLRKRIAAVEPLHAAEDAVEGIAAAAAGVAAGIGHGGDVRGGLQ